MKLTKREIYDNQMLFGSHKMKVNSEFLKYSIVTFKNKLSYIKENKFINSLYRAIKAIDKTKNTLIFCDDILLKEQVLKICDKKKKISYLIGKWPAGLLSNPNLLKQSITAINNLKKQLLETTNKKTISILTNNIGELEKTTVGFKNTDVIQQVIYVGELTKNVIFECSNTKIIATTGTEFAFSKINNPIFCNDKNYFTKLKILELIEQWIKKK